MFHSAVRDNSRYIYSRSIKNISLFQVRPTDVAEGSEQPPHQRTADRLVWVNAIIVYDWFVLTDCFCLIETHDWFGMFVSVWLIVLFYQNRSASPQLFPGTDRKNEPSAAEPSSQTINKRQWKRLVIDSSAWNTLTDVCRTMTIEGWFLSGIFLRTIYSVRLVLSLSDWQS